MVLILANVGYWTWNRPEVVAWRNPGPEPGREPERLQQQIHPEKVRILTTSEARSMGIIARQRNSPRAEARRASGAATDALLCLESATLSDEEFGQLTQELQKNGFTRTDWEDRRREYPGRWEVVLGPLSDQELPQRIAALRKLKIDAEEIKSQPDVSPGLMLGRYKDPSDAEKRLNEVAKQGVRNARVVEIKPQRVEHRLRIDALTESQAAKVRESSTAIKWQACES